ncbi:MAG: BMP family ABC transporter substrate-binding protein [bacterium]|nr:BMP family ABC transporter substrate-binding protein [Acidimicrobiia bacterium]MCY4650868.1 BMP family ABC transporter substrate-binding protein [bacterium]
MKNRKMTLGICAMLTLALLASACGGEEEAEADGPSLIYVTPNPIGVNKFLELGQVGTQRVADELGGAWKTFESTNDSDRRANIEAAIDEAPDVVVLTTFTLVELADELSKANPDQKFILIDACPDEPAANLHCGVFREHEGAYLLGIMAGHLSQAKEIGSVVALDIPFLHRWSDSFALGAQSIDPSITDTQVFIGGDNPFSDPARAKEQALAVAARGADHIFAVGAGSNGGIFEAAVQEGFLSYGVDVNQCPEAPGHIVDNNLKLVDVLVEQLAKQVIDGTAGPVVAFGLAEGGTGVVALSSDEELADSQCVIADHPDIVAAVREARDGIVAGDIVVPDPLFG